MKDKEINIPLCEGWKDEQSCCTCNNFDCENNLKEKQIEEIAKVICATCLSVEQPCYMNNQPCSLTKKQAKALYEQGYRKLPFYNSRSETITITKEMFQKVQFIIGSRGSGKSFTTNLIRDSIRKGIEMYIEKLKEHYPHSASVCKTIDKVASDLIGDL